MNNKLTREIKGKLLTYLFSRLDIGDELDTMEFQLEGGGPNKKFQIAYGKIKVGDEEIIVLFSLTTASNNIFFALTYERERDAAVIIANIEDYESQTSTHLHAGEVVVMPPVTSSQDGDGPYGVLLIRTASSPILKKIPDKQVIGDVEIQFHLVVLLSKDDFEYRKKFGHDALMDRWDNEGRDIAFY